MNLETFNYQAYAHVRPHTRALRQLHVNTMLPITYSLTRHPTPSLHTTAQYFHHTMTLSRHNRHLGSATPECQRIPLVPKPFLTLWRTLPTEIHFLILAHVFPSHYLHCAIDHAKHTRDTSLSSGPLLALFSVPEIAHLAKEVYYKSHVFAVSLQSGEGLRGNAMIRLPGGESARWVRRLRVTVRPRACEWAQLCRILSRFPLLNQLTVIVKDHVWDHVRRTPSGFSTHQPLEAAPTIVLSASVKELVVRYDGDGFVHDYGGEGVPGLTECFTMPGRVFAKIGLEGVGVRETRDRFYDVCVMRQWRVGRGRGV
jgi:hypothetical protein